MFIVYTTIMALYLLFNQGLQIKACPKISDGNRVVLIICDIVDQYFTYIIVGYNWGEPERPPH